MAAALPLATLEDLESGWRALDEQESAIAQTLLIRASAIVVDRLEGAGVSATALTGSRSVNARTVVCEMVRASMVNARTGSAGIFGEVAETETWEQEPEGGELVITTRQLRMLGIGGGHAGLVRFGTYE